MTDGDRTDVRRVIVKIEATPTVGRDELPPLTPPGHDDIALNDQGDGDKEDLRGLARIWAALFAFFGTTKSKRGSL